MESAKVQKEKVKKSKAEALKLNYKKRSYTRNLKYPQIRGHSQDQSDELFNEFAQ